jgi:hypothetical protein
VADTHGRLQNLRAGLNAEPLDRLPDRLHNFRRGVVGVGRRGARRDVLVVGEERAEFVGDRPPVAGRKDLKRIRHGAPAGEFHQDGLLIGRGRAVLGLQSLEGANGFEVELRFLAEAALTDGVVSSYSEIAGKG